MNLITNQEKKHLLKLRHQVQKRNEEFVKANPVQVRDVGRRVAMLVGNLVKSNSPYKNILLLEKYNNQKLKGRMMENYADERQGLKM